MWKRAASETLPAAATSNTTTAPDVAESSSFVETALPPKPATDSNSILPEQLASPAVTSSPEHAPSDSHPCALIRTSGLFDADFYDSQLRARGLDRGELSALEHYLQHGDSKGIAPNPLFDPLYYAQTNPDVAAHGVNTLSHYVKYGFREGRNPHPLVDLALIADQLGPDFKGDPLTAYLASSGPALRPHRLVDPLFIYEAQRRLAPSDVRPSLVFYLAQDPDTLNPSADFDGFAYRQMYPDTQPLPPLCHYAWRGEAEGRRVMKDRASLGRVMPQIEAAAAFDPDIVKPFADMTRLHVQSGYDLLRREIRLYQLLTRAAGAGPYAHVFLVPWLKFGGAERAAIHLAAALLEAHPRERVLFVCTQSDEVEALNWAPVTRRLTVARVAKEIDDVNDTYMAFANYLRFAGCRHLYVVNSRFGWTLIEKYGHALKSLHALHGFAFCHDYDSAGRKAGYAWTHLRPAMPHLAALVSDNSRTLEEFARERRFDARDREKFFCLYLPVDPTLVGRFRTRSRIIFRKGRGVGIGRSGRDDSASRRGSTGSWRSRGRSRRWISGSGVASASNSARTCPPISRLAGHSPSSATCRCTRRRFSCTRRGGTACPMCCSKRARRVCRSWAPKSAASPTSSTSPRVGWSRATPTPRLMRPRSGRCSIIPPKRWRDAIA